MARIRRRDIHAVAFCLVSISAVCGIIALVSGNWIYTLAVTGIFTAWLLTRARMVRVIRRLRGETVGGWSDYYRE